MKSFLRYLQALEGKNSSVNKSQRKIHPVERDNLVPIYKNLGLCLVGSIAIVQLTPSQAWAGPLEFGTNTPGGTPTSYSTPPNGPTTTSQTATILENTTGTTFANYSPPITVKAEILSQAYSNPSGVTPTPAFNFGANINNTGSNAVATPVFNLMNSISAAPNASFTSDPTGTLGTGISTTSNTAFSLHASVQPLLNAGSALNGRYYYGQVRLTFSRPVSNPVIHVVGLGGVYTSSSGINQGLSAELELQGSGVSLSRLSGSTELTVSANKILNNAATLNSATGSGAASGSILATGSNISSLTFDVYVRGDGKGSVWSETNRYSGDTFLIGASLAKPADLSLVKSHSGNFTVGTPGSYSLTVNNSASAGVTQGTITVTDTLPTGLTIPDGNVTLTGTNAANWTCTAASNVITCTSKSGITIAAGASNTFNLTGIQVGAAVVPSVTNTAIVSGGGEVDTTNNSASDTTSITVPTYTISGNVFDDADGSKVKAASGENYTAADITAVLLNGSNQVVSTAAVNATGDYSLSNVSPGTYSVKIIKTPTTALTVGAVIPPASDILPSNWTATGENNNGTPDATVDRTQAVTVSSANVNNINFGIEQLPDTTNVSSTSQTNLGGSTTYTVPTLTGTDPEDGAIGSGKSFKITSLPANGTLTYNGTAVTLNQIITNYNPTLLTVDPNDGVVTVTFNYASVDAASQVDSSPAQVSIPFTAPGLPTGYCSVIFGVDGNLVDTSLPSNIYTVNPSTSVYTQIGTAAFFTAAAAVQPSTGNIFYIERVIVPISGATQRIGYWNPNTGTNIVLPNTFTPANGYPIRAAFTKTGRLFVATNTQQLVELNPTTGLQIGSQLDLKLSDGTPLPDGNGDMAFDENGALFYFANSNLYGVDTVTGKAYLVANSPIAGFNSLALLPNGEMYGYSSGNNGFYSINTNTGAITFINNPTFPPNTVGSDLGTCGYTAPVIEPTKTVTKVSGSSGSLVRPGDTLEYTIIIPNSGYIIAANATLTDAVPTGTTYVANSSTMNGVAVADGTGGTFPFATGANISSPGSNVGVAGYGSSYTTTVKFKVKVDTTNPPTLVRNQGMLNFLGGPTGGVKTDDPGLPGTIDPTDQPVTINPNVVLVKRITAINGLTTNPNDGTLLNVVVDDSTVNDNHPKWPNPTSGSPAVSTFLKGAIDAGKVKPGDIIDYTIYFMNTQGQDAKNLKICDVVPDDLTFNKHSYGTEVGISLASSTATLPTAPNKNLSNLIDGDEGSFYAPGTNLPIINSCKKHDPNNPNNLIPINSSNNLSGVVFIELSNSLPAATSSGNPSNAYGFIRFRAKVK